MINATLIGGPYDCQEEAVREDQLSVVRYNAVGRRDEYLRFTRRKDDAEDTSHYEAPSVFFVHSALMEQGYDLIDLQLTARGY